LKGATEVISTAVTSIFRRSPGIMVGSLITSEEARISLGRDSASTKYGTDLVFAQLARKAIIARPKIFALKFIGFIMVKQSR
jgi:hypothetical protein